MSNSKLLRLEEVAHRLGISYTQARMLVLYDEKIPCFKVGARGVRVKEEDLEAYIAKQQIKEGKEGGSERDAGDKNTREPYEGRRILPAD